MNARTAETFFRCHREGRSHGADARLQKAVEFAGKDPELSKKLNDQIAFDARVTAAIGVICTPPGLIEHLRESEKAEGRPMNLRTALKSPPAIALGIALVVLAALGVFFELSRMEDFPGKDDVIRMIDENTDGGNAIEMEPKSAKAGEIEDWLFSKGLEGYFAPPELAESKIVGGRVFKQDGLPVAQIALEKNSMLAYAFRADDFGVKVSPPDSWRVFQDEDWVAAIQSHGGMCFMMTFRGSKADMQNFLATEGKK